MVQPSSVPDRPTVAGRRRSLRVLYAEDAPELRQVMRLAMSRDGHEIATVADGELGLQLLTADPHFDLVITDHQMPKVDGLAFVSGVRRLPYTGKIMVYCSRLGERTAADYVRLGVDLIAYKPISPREFRECIHSLFDR